MEGYSSPPLGGSLLQEALITVHKQHFYSNNSALCACTGQGFVQCGAQLRCVKE